MAGASGRTRVWCVRGRPGQDDRPAAEAAADDAANVRGTARGCFGHARRAGSVPGRVPQAGAFAAAFRHGKRAGMPS